MQEAARRLLELGLTVKEASVYLALLELGSAPVQEIAGKAQVLRPTTYATLETLSERGLVSRLTRGGKKLYAATSPQHFESILLDERSRIESRRQKLAEALPFFMAMYNAVESKPTVRFFEGEEGIGAIRDALMDASGEYLSFTAIDEATERLSRIQETQRHRLARRVNGRLIYSLKPGCARPPAVLKHWEIREIAFAESPFTGEINIVEDKVGAFVVKQQAIGFLVESPELATMFRAIFNAAWLAAKPSSKDLFENID